MEKRLPERGIQDVHYGRAKDLTSKSFNFIRDTVFQGNQEAYDAWGNINMMVAGLLVPIGQGTKAGAGLGVKAIARESASSKRGCKRHGG